MADSREIHLKYIGMSGGESENSDVAATLEPEMDALVVDDKRDKSSKPLVENMDISSITKTGMSGGKAVQSVVAAEIHGDVGSIKSHAEAGANVINIAGCPGAAISLEQECISGTLSQDGLKNKIEHVNQTFVQTAAYGDTKRKLQNHGNVTLCGAPGDGKTVIALKLCEDYLKGEFYVAFVDRIDRFDVNECLGRSARVLIVFDNVFEQDSSHEERTFKLVASQVGSKEQNVRVIITAKSYNLNEGLSRMMNLKVNLFRAETIINLTSKNFTEDEKCNLIDKLTNVYGKTDLADVETKKAVTEMNVWFGFPRICSMYFENERKTLGYFEYPIAYLRETLDPIIFQQGDRSALLILLFMRGGRADLMSLKKKRRELADVFDDLSDTVPNWTWNGLHRESKNFHGTFLTLEDGCVQFSHSAVYDAICCAVGNLNPQLMVDYCSVMFLKNRVRLRKPGEVQHTEVDSDTNIVHLAPIFRNELRNRLEGGFHSESC